MRRAFLVACHAITLAALTLSAWRVCLAALVVLRHPVPAVASDAAWTMLLTAGPFLLAAALAALASEALRPEDS